METTLSSKGQIVIPLQIRNSHGWRPGISFTIIDNGNSLILQPVNTKTVKPNTTMLTTLQPLGFANNRSTQPTKNSVFDLPKYINSGYIDNRTGGTCNENEDYDNYGSV